MRGEGANEEYDGQQGNLSQAAIQKSPINLLFAGFILCIPQFIPVLFARGITRRLEVV